MGKFFMVALSMALLGGAAVFAADTNPAVEANCSTCHSTRIIYAKKKTTAEWDATVQRMIDKHGLKISADQEKAVKDYLYTLKK